MPKVTNKEEIMVIVVTQGNAIYWGWTRDPDGETVKLRNARQVVYYSADTHGLLGLAATGPGKQSRIGPPVASTTIRNVTQTIECSPEAARAWEDAKWTS